jgi:hypothetical protein
VQGDLRRTRARDRSIGEVLRRPVVALVLALLWTLPGAAWASADRTVLVMDPGGRVHAERDAFLPPANAVGGDVVAPGSDPGGTASANDEQATAGAAVRGRASVPSELRRLRGAGLLDAEQSADYQRQWTRARRALKRLKGGRKRDLAGVLSAVSQMAADGLVTGSRVHDLLLTVRRNQDWWENGPLLSYGKRVRFTGSRLTWQYYPGQGIQIQWLGTFARMNNLFLAGGHDAELREMAQEVSAHAVERAGGIAWEYLFRFGGGRPPWVSGLAQGTAIQALSRAAVRLREPDLFDVARNALGVFRAPPPSGIRVRTAAGAHYLAYSYAPGQRIYNAFFQSIIGLHDFATFANDPLGRRLWLDGERQARLEVRRADTGSWSLYQPGRLSDIGYHKVLRDFVRRLCDRLNADRQREVTELRAVKGPGAVLESLSTFPDPGPYCLATQNFNRYLYSRLRALGLPTPWG